MLNSAAGIIGSAASLFLECLAHVLTTAGALLAKLLTDEPPGGADRAVVDVNDDDGQPDVQFRLDQTSDSSIELLDDPFSPSTDRLTRLRTTKTVNRVDAI